MESSHIYGVVVDNFLYSNRMEVRVNKENGIYGIDMSQDDYLKSLTPASIDDARKFFSKASKIAMIRGISFHDGIIPDNPVSYAKIPIKVTDPTYDEFEEIEVVLVRNKICYYVQNIYTPKGYPLGEVREAFKDNKGIDNIKGVTPEIRLAYTFHIIEKKKKEIEEPINALKSIMVESGANVKKVRKTNLGYEVTWSFQEYEVITEVDKNFKVTSAGFCTSGYDYTQSARSVVHLLRDYHEKRVSKTDFVNIGRFNHVHERGRNDNFDDEDD